MLNRIYGLLSKAPFVNFFFQKSLQRRELRRKIKQDSELNIKHLAQNITSGIKSNDNLYKELIVKIHPDKFPEIYKSEATSLSSKLNKARHNYNKLTKLKVEIHDFLEKTEEAINN